MGYLRRFQRAEQRARQPAPEPPDLRRFALEHLSEQKREAEIQMGLTIGLRYALLPMLGLVLGPIGRFLAQFYDAPDGREAPPVPEGPRPQLIVVRHEAQEDPEGDLVAIVERQARVLQEAMDTDREDEERERLLHYSHKLLGHREERAARERQADELGEGTPLTDREASMGIENMNRQYAWVERNWEAFGWQHWGQRYY